jgi:hypothetical protein
MPAGVRFPRPRRITIRVGEAVTFPDVANDKHGWERIARAVESQIKGLATASNQPRRQQGCNIL